jgi:hypothetical protein
VGTAVFGERETMVGAGICGLKLTVTLSNVTPVVDDKLPLFTSSPTYTSGVMLTVVLPARLQVAPSGEA